jgi:hypothetical protein
VKLSLGNLKNLKRGKTTIKDDSKCATLKVVSEHTKQKNT